MEYNTLYATYIHRNITLYYVASRFLLYDKLKSSIFITKQIRTLFLCPFWCVFGCMILSNSDTFFVSVLVRLQAHDVAWLFVASPNVYSRRLLVYVRAFRRLLVYVRAFGVLFERILAEVIRDFEMMASVAKLYPSNSF